LLSTLEPHQLGDGVSGNAEAIVYTVCTFVASGSPFHTLVKLYFSSVFNTVCRDCIIEFVAAHVPSILSYVISPFYSHSFLLLGSYSLHVLYGVQQGEPWGPLLLSL